MQKHTSKDTSINTKRLPAVYGKIDWNKYTNKVDDYHVIDYGCGCKKTQKLIKDKLLTENIEKFFPWDPYHECIVGHDVTELCMDNTSINKVVICSNVLNVVDTISSLVEIIIELCNMIVVQLPDGTYRMNPCYITVYEGDKSGVGRETKKDCWQRNERLEQYLNMFNNYIKRRYGHNSDFFKIKYGMIVGINQYPKKVR